MNKKEIAQQFTLARRSFSEGGKQMLDPNQPSINFEQVTNMLKEIEQTHKEILSGIENCRILQKILDRAFTDHHSQLDSSKEQLEKLTNQLTKSSTQFSKFRRSSLWQGYWTAIVVGVISALLTNLIWWISL